LIFVRRDCASFSVRLGDHAVADEGGASHFLFGRHFVAGDPLKCGSHWLCSFLGGGSLRGGADVVSSVRSQIGEIERVFFRPISFLIRLCFFDRIVESTCRDGLFPVEP